MSARRSHTSVWLFVAELWVILAMQITTDPTAQAESEHASRVSEGRAQLQRGPEAVKGQSGADGYEFRAKESVFVLGPEGTLSLRESDGTIRLVLSADQPALFARMAREGRTAVLELPDRAFLALRKVLAEREIPVVYDTSSIQAPNSEGEK